MQEQSILKKEMELGGRTLSIETGRVAKQANGSVLIRYGDTAVLVTSTMSKKPREGIDFLPLTVDYEERLYSVGKIPGGFIKREGRPSEKATLSARLIDRPLRPLFPKKLRNDIHVISTIMSVDQDNPPEITAMIGASSALTISDIPFDGPIAGVIVGRVDGEYVVNPTTSQAEKSDMHLVVAGTKDAIMMVEAGASQVPEDILMNAIFFGHDAIKEVIEFINSFHEEAAKMNLVSSKIELEEENETDLMDVVSEVANKKIKDAVRECIVNKYGKKKREDYLDSIRDEIIEYYSEEYPDSEDEIIKIIKDIEKREIRLSILNDHIRVDGRALNEVRPINVEVGLLPRTHGCGLFTRGETQVLSSVTLGAVSEEQILDGLGAEATKRFMHHYNFPPYSVGETKPLRSPGRREIGHGALAERALEPVIPSENDFPYTVRIVSEVLESNGSTSMGSVCGSCLGLMDAGVPISDPVAGVAMGLVKEDANFGVLTDIQGLEDHMGDMDFKVAGTEKGVTALQMDIKISGIDRDILKQALSQATEGRMHILNKMKEVIDEPRRELSPYAPRIIRTYIEPEKIRDVIGPGGKTIKKIIEETGVEVDIEDDGRVFIAAVNPEAGKKAEEIIKQLTEEVKTGQMYDGKVTKVTDFGAFVEVVPGILGMPGKEGLVHISQLAHNRVNKVEDVVSEGDEIQVKSIGYDNMGRLKLSKKEAMPPPPPEDNQEESSNGKKQKDNNNNNKKFTQHKPGPKRNNNQ
ncbi:MAG: polyribonucleotide nucleotidyltransferase [Clostridiales bacterium]|nr:polyribonucleotide nucleotidyltransferase [Clostridiales bacterium]MCF8022188.1 polyribonucleotide nucleotidyltransferase [Clostridiales bacterium]